MNTVPSELLIVDADGHYVEDVKAWASMIPARLRGIVPELIVESGTERFVIGDQYCLPSRTASVNQMGGMTMGDGMNPRRSHHEGPQVLGRRLAQSAPGGLDPKERLRLMDEEGIAVSVLYPTLGLACFTALKDARLAGILAAALNDWIVERFCSADPDRLFAVATIPLHDPDFAVHELERCVTELKMKAAWVNPAPTMGRTIADPAYEKLWEKAAHLGVPMTTHFGSGGGGTPALGRDRDNTWLGAHSMTHPFEAMAAIVSLYTSRMFQKYPTLKWGFMEAGCGWLPFWLEQIHEHADRMRFLVPGLKDEEEISDIFRERCIVTAEGDDPFVKPALDASADRCVVWASDFPHFDCVMPGLTKDVRERTDLSPARQKKLAGKNALDFFGLKVPARAKIRVPT
jgi:predicted TIM-barrel fold metal-dependent hydrolase